MSAKKPQTQPTAQQETTKAFTESRTIGQAEVRLNLPTQVKRVERSEDFELNVSDKYPSGVWSMGAAILHKQGIRGSGVKIGIIDTGIDDSHPDLNKRVKSRRDYVKDGANPSEFQYHGTHVAGTVAGTGNKIWGVAPDAELADYRVLDKNGSGTNENVTKAITDAVTDGCHIISMSLGGPSDFPPMHDAIRKAVEKGVLVIVAAGNEGEGSVSYPAFYPEVISVGAVDFDVRNGKIIQLRFAATNPELDVCADGYQVVSTFPKGEFGVLDGTSMATPHVAGFAALLIDKVRKQAGRNLTEDGLFLQLKGMAVDVFEPGIDQKAGAGFVTFFPSIPTRQQNGNWSFPDMYIGAPK